MGRLIGLSLIFAVLLALTIVLFVKSPHARWRTQDGYEDNGYTAKFVEHEHRLWYSGFVPLFILLIMLAATSLTSVHARNEGVLIAFGKPSSRTLDPGGHIKWYWQSVEQIDGTNKTENLNTNSEDDVTKAKDDNTTNHHAIKVRLGDGNTAEAYVSVRWSATPDRANDIYAQYRGTDPIGQMRDNLLLLNLRQVVNDVLGTYSPTAAIDNLDIDFTDPAAITTALRDIKINPDFDLLTSEIQKGLQDALGPDALIEIKQVTFSFLDLPKQSQDRIAAFLTEVNNTRIALQHQATNVAQALANEKLAASLAQNPNVLVSECFDLIRSGDLVLPAGGSCWPGGQSAVVVPATK